MTADPDWDHYRSFLAVLREGTLSGAARRLGLTQPTIGRHIDELEARLGVALFSRAPSGLLPTEAARMLEPHAAAMEAAAGALLRMAGGGAEAARGTVRLTASEIVGVEVLPPMLTAIRRDHPDIVLELAPGNRNEDVLHRAVDIAVRMTRPTQGALVARHIGTVPIGLFARRDYLARRGTPRRLADLDGHDIIGFDREKPALRGLEALAGALDRDRFALRTDHDLAMLAMLRAGFGLGLCQRGIGLRDGLVPLLEKDIAIPLDIWMTMHGDLRGVRRMRIVFDGLAEGLATYVRASAPKRQRAS